MKTRRMRLSCAALNRAVAAAVLLGLSGTSQPLRAQEGALNCDQALSTYEMNACAEAELTRADAQLNAAFQEAIASIPSRSGDPPYDAKAFEEALRASQRAWIAFRDSDCKTELPMHWTGGTGTTSAVLGCLIEKTEARTKELKERFASE